VSPESLKVRVERLEHRVETVEQLPGRVSALESQIVLLREELRSEFSAMQTVIRDVDEDTRRYMRMLHEDLIQRVATLGEGRHR
jgi:archaellum component FlaC